MKRIYSLLAFISLAQAVQAADFAPTVNDLIPQLADVVVTNRYAAQMQLQALAANASKPGNEADRVALATLLAAKAGDASVPQPSRVWLIRQIEYIGGTEAVPVLTQLLAGNDAELRECARRALEKNPAPAASASLRAALQKGGETNWKIGLIRSLGQKHDAQSVALIAPLLNDPQLGGPAAKALGGIATPEAMDALWKVFETQPVAAEALADSVSYLLSTGVRNGPVATAHRLFQQSKASHIRAAALSLLAKGDPGIAKQLIEPALQGSDVRLQKAGVDVALVVYGKDASSTLAGVLPKLPATAKTFALCALTADPAAEKAALACVGDKEESVHLAALETLGRIGTAASVPALINAGATGSDPGKTAAAAALARINGGSAGEAIQKQAASGNSAERVVAITALGARAAKSELPALLRYAGESDRAVSRAALQTIGKLGGEESLDGLVKLALDGKAGVREALLTVANRCKDKSAVGRRLAQQAQQASGQRQTALFEVMALVGGRDGLNAIVSFTTTGTDDVKDAAIRALCQWQEFDAVKPLLSIAAAPGAKEVHTILALRAVCRLVELAQNEPPQSRVDAVQAGLKAAVRSEEKMQLVSALATIKNRKAADVMVGLLADPALKSDVALAALNLAEGIHKTDRSAATKLAEEVKRANISPALTKRAAKLLASR